MDVETDLREQRSQEFEDAVERASKWLMRETEAVLGCLQSMILAKRCEMADVYGLVARTEEHIEEAQVVLDSLFYELRADPLRGGAGLALIETGAEPTDQLEDAVQVSYEAKLSEFFVPKSE